MTIKEGCICFMFIRTWFLKWRNEVWATKILLIFWVSVSMQLIADCEVLRGGDYTKRFSCASISKSPMPHGYLSVTLLRATVTVSKFILVLLYRKISEKSREEWSLFAKNVDNFHVTHDAQTHQSLLWYVNATCARNPLERATPSTNWANWDTARSA